MATIGNINFQDSEEEKARKIKEAVTDALATNMIQPSGGVQPLDLETRRAMVAPPVTPGVELGRGTSIGAPLSLQGITMSPSGMAINPADPAPAAVVPAEPAAAAAIAPANAGTMDDIRGFDDRARAALGFGPKKAADGNPWHENTNKWDEIRFENAKRDLQFWANPGITPDSNRLRKAADAHAMLDKIEKWHRDDVSGIAEREAARGIGRAAQGKQEIAQGHDEAMLRREEMSNLNQQQRDEVNNAARLKLAEIKKKATGLDTFADKVEPAAAGKLTPEQAAAELASRRAAAGKG